MSDHSPVIRNWNENDLLDLPSKETNYYEYKSSRIAANTNRLKEEICVAASAFWNSGGGVLLVGLDDSGKIDGGIPTTIGRQSVPDWIDRILLQVEPTGEYEVKLIFAKDAQSSITSDNAVLAISFAPSFFEPHMAPDNRYYVRAGAHSLPVGHYIVEALRARRGLHEPVLRGLRRMHPRKDNVVQLVILNLTGAPALQVTIDFNPLPKAFAEHVSHKFPLHSPIISREYPFEMDISLFPGGSEVFGDVPVDLHLSYHDIAGRHFNDVQTLSPQSNLGPLTIGNTQMKDIRKAVEGMAKEVKQLRQSLELYSERILAAIEPEEQEDS